MKRNVPGAPSSGRCRVYPAGGCAAPTLELSLTPALGAMGWLPKSPAWFQPLPPICGPGLRSGRGEGIGSPRLESWGLARPADPGLRAERRGPGWWPAQRGRMLPAAGAPWVGAGCGGQVWEPQGCVNAPAPPVHPNPACWAAAGGSILDQEPALEGCVQPCCLVSLFKACVTDGTQRRGLLCDFMLCLSVVLLFMYVFLLTSCFFGLWFPPMCCSISLLNGLAVTLQPSSTLPWAAQSLRGGRGAHGSCAQGRWRGFQRSLVIFCRQALLISSICS